MTHNTHVRSLGLGLGLMLAAAMPATAGNVLEVPGPLNLTIQEALDIAQSLGVTQLNLAPGVYPESVVFPASGWDLVIMGDPDDPASVVIDPSAADPPILDSAIHINGGQTAATQLIGLTITGGNADGVDDGDLLFDERGGGVYLDVSSMIAIDCVFELNFAEGFGGAVYSNGGAVTSFTRCQFEENSVNSNGGALYINDGTLDLIDCSFTSNHATGSGGAVRIQPTTTIERCTFQENTAGASGGAMLAAFTTTVNHSQFIANDAAGNGGAIVITTGNVQIRDSILNGNTAGNSGSAISVASAGNLTLVNDTIVHNAGGHVVFGDGTKTVSNSILWSNSGGSISGGTNNVSYSMVQGGFPGPGVITPGSGPEFVDAAGNDSTVGTADDDLHLSASSPAIDGGDSTTVIGQYPVDFEGLVRAVDDPDTADTGVAFLGLAVDMGAHEFQPEPAGPSCPGDINGDQQVDTIDFLAVLGAWGMCP